jgi:protocatechuate 3,4-dioxygenase beta subunit
MAKHYSQGCWQRKHRRFIKLAHYASCMMMVASGFTATAQAQFYAGESSPPLGYQLPHFDCSTPTPLISGAGDSYPGHDKIIASNRLAMPAGKAVAAQGQIMYFMGRVLDKDCVPVKGAKLELWQANASGKLKVATPAELASPEPVFAGAGKTHSNNLGEYQFITVFPGVNGNRAPHLHLRITHDEFPPITTEVFFAQDRRNANDYKLRRFRDKLKERVTARMMQAPGGSGALVALFDVILKGKSRFQQF